MMILALTPRISEEQEKVYSDAGFDGVIFKGSQMVNAVRNALNAKKASPSDFIVIKS
jgi:hypothetical protein